jgi:hypothetical protein
MSMAKGTDDELHVTNNTSANRETLCRLFLASHLPPKYRVTTGEIIDVSSNQTGQLDVVIVNEFAPLMTLAMTDSVIAPILADLVLGVLEVKTSLTTETLRKALSQLRPVKALMPTHTTLERTDGSVVRDPLGGKIITGVFAFNPAADIESKVPEILRQFPHVADFVVIPSAFGFFSLETLRVCGFEVADEEAVNGYVKYAAKGMGLAIMFGVLNSIAAQRRFSGSNCVRYLSGTWGGTPDDAFRLVEQRLQQLQKRALDPDSRRNLNVAQQTVRVLMGEPKARRPGSDPRSRRGDSS